MLYNSVHNKAEKQLREVYIDGCSLSLTQLQMLVSAGLPIRTIYVELLSGLNSLNYEDFLETMGMIGKTLDRVVFSAYPTCDESNQRAILALLYDLDAKLNNLKVIHLASHSGQSENLTAFEEILEPQRWNKIIQYEAASCDDKDAKHTMKTVIFMRK